MAHGRGSGGGPPVERLHRIHDIPQRGFGGYLERRDWDEYIQAFEDAITATSTPWAPWYVIPADHKHVLLAMVASILVDTVGSLGLSWPTVSDTERKAHAEARAKLAAEDGAGDP